jgi:hypothetical protein
MIMRYNSLKQIASSCLLGAALTWPATSWADPTVHSGWDLLTTGSGTTVNWVPFQGVPLGVFDFGGSIGLQNVGNTDTIIQRPTDIIGSSGGTVAFTAYLAALQLRSVSLVNFGGGPLGYYYLTLQSVRGGPASTDTGSMTFNADPNVGGTFTDTLDVFFDIRYGSLNGPIVFSDSCLLNNPGAAWTHDGSYPPIIDGVNHLLDGTDTSQDFWPGYIAHFDSLGNVHIIPEPSGLVLFGLGVLALVARLRSGRG